MSTDELWRYFEGNAIMQDKPFDRQFLWVSETIFAEVSAQFTVSTNWFHPGTNYRSNGKFYHIHAIAQGALVHLHRDTGNVGKGWHYVIPHIWFDVVPYLWYSLKSRKPLYILFEHPK